MSKPIIINHDHELYREKWNAMDPGSRRNGAFYYSKSICKNIIPNVNTDRNWVTIRAGEECVDHSIVFIHNNINSAERYDFLKNYNDLILVCGIPETMDVVKHLGTPIYLPLSIDVEYVKQFKLPKEQRHGACYVGRPSKRDMTGVVIPSDVDIIEGMKRQDMLPLMAKYETVYAVGRTAIEAKTLGCKLKPFDPRFPKVSRWKVLDNKQAAKMLQVELDKIDK